MFSPKTMPLPGHVVVLNVVHDHLAENHKLKQLFSVAWNGRCSKGKQNSQNFVEIKQM